MDGKFIGLLLTASATAFGSTWWYLSRPPSILENHVEAAEPIVTPKGEKLSFKDCGEVIAKGYAPLVAGRPGYTPELDRDGDGVACPPTS